MIIAIDPGKTGGIAILSDHQTIQAFKMPDTDGDVIEFFNEKIPLCQIEGFKSVCYMEKVGGFIGMRTKYIVCPQCRNQVPVQSADPGSAMFKFGYGNGFLISTVMTRKIPLEMVTPQSWMKALSLGTKSGMSKTDWKNKLKAMAQRLYPNLKVTLNTCDALLILKYAKMREASVMQGGQSKDYSKKINEAYEGKPQPYTWQVEMPLENENLPF